MSSDMMNNQMLKDASAGSQVRLVQEMNNSQKRQEVAASGNELPVKEVEQKETEVSAEKLQEVVEQLNSHAQAVNRDLHFSVDDASGRTVIRVVNSETAELVRQIPTEEVLRLSQTLRESQDNVTGVIVQTSA